MRRGLLPDSPRSILLVRLSARGDIVFSSPLVKAFRDTYPDAKLTWMAEAHTKDLIQNHPGLDDVIVWERGRWKKLLKERRLGALASEIRRFVGDLRRRNFDVAIDLQGLLRSGIMAFLSGAPTRIGLGSKEGSRIFMSHVLSRGEGDIRKISSEYRYLAEELGLEVGEFRMEVPLSEADRNWARSRESELGLEGGFMVAVPFTTRPQKHWFEDRWAQLMDRITRDMGLPVVVLGGPDDVEAFQRIRDLAETEPVDLVGKTSLIQAGAMLQRASLVVGVDTGLTHMSIAFDRPTVTIFGSNIPYTITPTDRAKVLVHWLECSPCKGNPTCDGAFTCLKLVTVEEVLEAVREVRSNAAQDAARRRGQTLPTVEP